MGHALRTAFLAAALTGPMLLAGCRFERRPDPRGVAGTPADTAVAVSGGAVRDSVRAVVAAFHDALRLGDGGRVASLSVLGATILDQEEGVEWRLGVGGGDHLPGPLMVGRGGLGWRRTGTAFVAWESTALVVDRYRATVSGEEVPWTAVETLVLERTAEGWRIRHVHRSRGTTAAPDRMPEPDGEERP